MSCHLTAVRPATVQPQVKAWRERYSGETLARVRPQTFRQVLRLLSAGPADRKIAPFCKVSPATIDAIRRRNAETIGAQKQALASLASRIAHGEGGQIEDELHQHKIHGSQLVPVFGVAVDKLMMLADQPTARLAVEVGVNVHNIYEEFAAAQTRIVQALRESRRTPELPPIDAEVVSSSGGG